jgi:DNA-binding transcriptional LysR family regulator
MDRVEAMSILLHAVEAGSLSKASRNLRLPLATVSRKVSELEAHLNTTLFTRSAKGLMPTPAGHSFITAAKAILELMNEAERTASGEYTAPKGDLAVTAPTMFGRLHVLPVLKDFLSAYPEVDVGLVLTDRIAHFVDDQVDVALRIGNLPDSALTATRVGSVRRVVCASPACFAPHGSPVTPDDHSIVRPSLLEAPPLLEFGASTLAATSSTQCFARASASTRQMQRSMRRLSAWGWRAPTPIRSSIMCGGER